MRTAKSILLVGCAIFLRGCIAHDDPINNLPVIKVSISAFESPQHHRLLKVISDADSIRTIIRVLNRGIREPMKFRPTHLIQLTFGNGTQDSVVVNEKGMNHKGFTYKCSVRVVSLFGL